jgi:hypothetical protein
MTTAISYFPNHLPKDLEDSFSILFAFCVKPPVVQKAPQIVTHYELHWNEEPKTDANAT